MANLILKAFLGKNLTVTAQPLTISDTGGMSANGAAMAFVGRLEELGGGKTDVQTEPVVPMDSFPDNDVPIGEVTSYSLAELMTALPIGRSTPVLGQRLLQLVSVCRYFTLTLTGKTDAGTTIFAEVGTVLWTSYDPSYRRGNAKGRLECRTIGQYDGTTGAYQPNPVVTGAGGAAIT